jgi:aminoglycoside 6'-N-acetyltransferase I
MPLLLFPVSFGFSRPELPNTQDPMLEIVAFESLTPGQRAQAADILHRALAHMKSAYSPEEAAEEVAKFGGEDCNAFAALENGNVLGWIGVTFVYDYSWELHPLVVDPRNQKSGIGSALIAHLEDYARQDGVLNLYLATDDDYGGTNLSGIDLFPDPLAKLATIQPVKGHPFTFYRKLGFSIVGILPDGNGFGQPDIMMAKRI